MSGTAGTTAQPRGRVLPVAVRRRQIISSLKGVISPKLATWKAIVTAPRRNGHASVGNRPTVDPAQQKAGSDRSDRPGAAGGRKPTVMWFRNDLRLHDNEALASANREGTSLLPVFCFDPREFGGGGGSAERDTTGPYRAQFIVEAVAELRDSLRAAGSDLIIRLGKPEKVLPELARKAGAARVYCHGEVSFEEAATEARVAAALRSEEIALKTLWGSTLHRPEDLPFKIEDTPATHGEFRRAVAGLPVPLAEGTPSQLHGKPLGARGVAAGDVPTLAQLGLAPVQAIPGVPRCCGGEAEGQAQLSRLLASAALSGQNFAASFSAKVSPWLAMGCLSPRRMYTEVKAKQGACSAQVAALAHSELLWRDFFRFTAKKYASASLARPSQPAPARGSRAEAAERVQPAAAVTGMALTCA